ncbi:MAG: hypothetical protein WCF18_01635 [Chthoniobacteraceae bacterium]
MKTADLILSGALAALPQANVDLTVTQPLTQRQFETIDAQVDHQLDPWRATVEHYHIDMTSHGRELAPLVAYLEAQTIAYALIVTFRT